MINKQDSVCRLSLIFCFISALSLLFCPFGCSQRQADTAVEPIIVEGEQMLIWQACQDELRARGFSIDRAQRRSGEIATEARTSSQWFEFWARDVATGQDLAESSLHTTRRQVSVFVEPVDENRYQINCEVLVQRYAPIDDRIGGTVYVGDVMTRAVGGREHADGIDVEPEQSQWNSLGADADLALEILTGIRNRVNQADQSNSASR